MKKRERCARACVPAAALIGLLLRAEPLKTTCAVPLFPFEASLFFCQAGFVLCGRIQGARAHTHRAARALFSCAVAGFVAV
jgi:hypothetical protein